MSVDQRNAVLLSGQVVVQELRYLFPRLHALEQMRLQFTPDFGLDTLPNTGGVIIVRGPRQYGKSTWLESKVVESVQQSGPGSTAYINGDEFGDWSQLRSVIEDLLLAMDDTLPLRRIFIDEITAVTEWTRAIKILADQGKLERTLIVTTGSQIRDLRRGEERLPGRKGKLARTDYIFTGVSFKQFTEKASSLLNSEQLLIAYLLSGGSPLALNELAEHHILPEWLITLTRDWIFGELARAGRSRGHLTSLIPHLFRLAPSPIGYTLLARESGMANNTVAREYIEFLSDLMTVFPAYSWDIGRKVTMHRHPCKFHFVNLLAAVSFSPTYLRSIADFLKLSPEEQAPWYEWLIAQELVRRAARNEPHEAEQLKFWRSKEHEIDFVDRDGALIEVKRGKTSPLEFTWFSKSFPKESLKVVNQQAFNAHAVRGVTFQDFLLDD